MSRERCQVPSRRGCPAGAGRRAMEHRQSARKRSPLSTHQHTFRTLPHVIWINPVGGLGFNRESDFVQLGRIAVMRQPRRVGFHTHSLGLRPGLLGGRKSPLAAPKRSSRHRRLGLVPCLHGTTSLHPGIQMLRGAVSDAHGTTMPRASSQDSRISSREVSGRRLLRDHIRTVFVTTRYSHSERVAPPLRV